MNNKISIILGIALTFSFLPLDVVLAQEGGDTTPVDPGATDGQNSLISSSIFWLFAGDGAIINLNDPNVDVALDWSSLNYAGKINTVDGHYVFVGIDGVTYILDEEAHDEYHPGVGEGVGFAFGLGLLKRLADCAKVWVEPGAITPYTEKVSPAYPLVVKQDPDNTGVSLTYSLAIEPTTVYYQKWGKIADIQACTNINDPEDTIEPECSYNGSGILKCKPDDGGNCPEGYAKQKTSVWGCRTNQKTYQESIASIVPKAVLTQDSRDWILGTLSQYYPGTSVKKPVWNFWADSNCTWQDNTCTWSFNASSIPVEDPGLYDVILSGSTGGTTISVSRSFNFTLDQFGVYLIDASIQ